MINNLLRYFILLISSLLIVACSNSASTNANLSNLSISAGAFSPAFNSGTLSYTLAVGSEITSTTVTATAEDSGATITVNGSPVTSGSASLPVPLGVGSTIITVLVTAEDGSTTKTYTITVTRPASSNANLSALSISAGAFSPAFDAATLSYTLAVANTVASTTVTATVANSNAMFTVNGAATSSGTASEPIALAVGDTILTVDVTAEDGTPQSYTITVSRAPSSDANLAGLSISIGTMIPNFSPSTFSYTIAVGNTVTSATVTATTAHGNATFTVNGIATISGSASAPIALAIGNNPIDVVVTAEDGTTSKTYTLSFTRAAAISTNADLHDLAISAGTLTPSFDSATTSYNSTVTNSATTTTITARVVIGGATLTVNGSSVTPGSPSASIPLNVGNNTITVLVTAEDTTTTKTYILTVYRQNNNANLSALSISAGTLNPAFAPTILTYNASVTDPSITVNATVADINATFTVNGSAGTSGSPTAPISLAVGSNTLSIEVTAEDGTTTKTYTITVYRQSANLSDLTLSFGNLDQTFQASLTSYTSTVGFLISSLNVTASTEDANASLTINGAAVTSGQPSQVISLAEGANTLTVLVTAQNGVTTKSYTVTVTRELSSLFAQQAYVKASNTGIGDEFGYSVALDGNTLAVGAYLEDSSTTGINTTENNNALNAGAVYVFTRSGITWTQQAYIKASNSELNDQFGVSLALDGDTLAVGANFEDSSTSGINTTANNNASNAGAVYVFTRSGSTWTQQAYIKAGNSGTDDEFGSSVALKGNTLAVGAKGEASSNMFLNDNNAPNAGAVYVFTRSGSSWSQQAFLKANNIELNDQFGISVSLDGDTLAVGAHLEDSSTAGVNSAANNNAQDAGAVYVFSRSGTSWSQQAYIKASNTGASDEFGISISLDGDTLAVGAHLEDSSTTGINSSSNNAASDGGAVYVFSRGGTNWSQQAYLKASNTGLSDLFGISVAVDGDTLAIGANGEDSIATGINQTFNESNNSVADSGAVYVLH